MRHPHAAFEVGFDVGFIYYKSGDISLTTAHNAPLQKQAQGMHKCYYLCSFFTFSPREELEFDRVWGEKATQDI